MDKGKKYKVVYNDGSQDRVKDLIFKQRDGALLEFLNTRNGRIEFVNETRVIRIEEIEVCKENGKEKESE